MADLVKASHWHRTYLPVLSVVYATKKQGNIGSKQDRVDDPLA
jgi:hypothetical protein